MTAIPEELTRLSWSKKMALIASGFRKARVSEDHVAWMKQQVLGDEEMLLNVMRASNVRTDVIDRGGKLTIAEDTAVTEILVTMHALARWADFGFNVFSLTEGLTAMLSLTDATAKYSDLRWPFPAFVLEVPPGYLPAVGDGSSPARVLVHEHLRHLEYDSVNKVYFETDSEHGVAEQWLRVEVYASSVMRPVFVLNRRISDLSKETIDSKILSWADGNAPEKGFVEAGDGTAILTATLSLVCNFALWLNATDALSRITPQARPKAKKKSKKKRDEGAWPSLWIVGREIKLDRELRDLAKEQTVAPANRRKGWKLRTQKVVRGHFKRQHHGPGNKLVKIIFVEPYARGPQDAEAWSSNFSAGVDN